MAFYVIVSQILKLGFSILGSCNKQTKCEQINCTDIEITDLFGLMYGDSSAE